MFHLSVVSQLLAKRNRLILSVEAFCSKKYIQDYKFLT